MVQGAGQQLQAIVEDELGEERLVQGAFFPSEDLAALPDGALARGQALRRPGRPIGSPNRRGLRLREFIKAKGYLHPMLFFAEGITRSARDLAQELGCTPYEAAKLQGDWADRLLPYLESKMPVAVLHAGALPTIELVDPVEAAKLFMDGDVEQIQALIDIGEGGVEQPELNSLDNVQQDQGASADAAVIADHGEGEA